MLADPLARRLVDFVAEIGVEVRSAPLPDPTFLPGLDIRDGALVIDSERLAYPGDILHEAGHIAVSEPEARGAAALQPTDAEEMAAIAWSWAAAVHLDVAPEVLFHPHGYKGGSDALIEAFTGGRYFGVPLLQWFGLTLEPRQAAERGLPPYPHMLRWLR